ncbi:MAG: 2-deoxycytidine 5-triphosphate deaminase [Robiginitomaculum sp.]|nr:MAG: 2-deoxycytidine 5-triphosphate deaminase [Robiginitomaculum sp.]
MGILPKQDIDALIESDALSARTPIEATQVQPASLDLRLGDVAYRLRASFLPGRERSISQCLDDQLVMHKIDLSGGAVLETGCVYLVPLQEVLNLPDDLSASANPKSSTGRLDVFTRVIADNAQQFEAIPAGYSGPLYVEIAPRTFSVLARPGDKLVQIRFRRGDVQVLNTQTVSIDLKGIDDDGIIGWRARRHSGLVDLSNIGGHNALEYWEPLTAPKGILILDPDEFYILASKESVQIPNDQAAEMAPIAPEIGEFRAHYAGFFDPGFGLSEAGGSGSRAVLEVRGRDVPFMLRHGQAVAKLEFEPMTALPENLYGQNGSHYQAQGLRLSKHFKLRK